MRNQQNHATRQPMEFVALESAFTGNSVLGYRADTSHMDLMNEADMRQDAAQCLLGLLSCLADFESSDNKEIAGCFNAVRMLVNDAAALQVAAYQIQRAARQGVEQ
ncbi:hypothetical protein EGJ86_10390 [Pseudomonas sp. o96-267]|uniref:hypothetical protein n=1 Tax=Pseudomonas sp. o96-267 TaxID=2479853 RepID=UPI000F78D0A1|nr:hypothetical protein [Pseudomonas sp. o96-267]RRV39831.1 hypothetical protein EGJ86_10390 [Pseudomonas sp. o96-267]